MRLTLDNVRHYCEPCGDCMLWKLGTNGRGYPLACINGKPTNVRRYLVQLKYGKALPKGTIAVSTHGCTDPRCLLHIGRGNRSDLLKRMYSEGRRSSVGEYLSRQRAAIKQGRTVLDLEKAREIRLRSHIPSRVLAIEYGVNRTTIDNIKRGRSWRESAPNNSAFAWAA